MYVVVILFFSFLGLCAGVSITRKLHDKKNLICLSLNGIELFRKVSFVQVSLSLDKVELLLVMLGRENHSCAEAEEKENTLVYIQGTLGK